MNTSLASVMGSVFSPRSIAVVGASNNKDKVGWFYLKALLDFGFPRVYAVNVREDAVQGLKAYKSVLDIPDEVEQAVLITPAESILSVVEECGRKGVKLAIVHTSGFGELGAAGVRLQQEMVRIARAAGLRLIGPNCMGVHCPSSRVTYDSIIMPDRDGPVGLISHSGSLSAFISEQLSAYGMSCGKAVSCGNDADLTAVDFLEYFGQDPSIRMVAMYLEGVRDGRRFLHVAREVSRRKPLIIWKAGTTERGSRAASSHTGALAGSIQVWRSVFAQAGITVVGGIEGLVDAAMAFWATSLPRDRRVAIVSSPGGVAVSLTDACVEEGLTLANLSEATHQVLVANVPGVGTSIGNPIDVGLAARFRPDLHTVAMEAADRDPNVDAILVVTKAGGRGDYTASIFDAMGRVTKPVVASVVGTPDAVMAKAPAFLSAGIAPYPDTRRAARALSWLYHYGAFLRRAGDEAHAREFTGCRS